MNDEKKVYQRKSLVWPVFLISLGLIVLLNNLNVIDWDIWLVLTRLWPLLLIVAGLDLIFGRRSGIWNSIFIIAVLAIFAFGAWIVQIAGLKWSGELVTHDVSYPLGTIELAEIDIDFSIGELKINSLSGSTSLLDGVIDTFDNETLKEDFSTDDEFGYLRLETSGDNISPPWFFNNLIDDSRSWDILLSDLVSIDLDVSTGVGLAVIDLRGLSLMELNVDSGVGETIVYLSDKGSYSVNISTGVGEMKVYIPEELAARIQLEIGIGDKSVSGDYQRSGNFYISPNYGEAEDQVEIYISGGIGSLEVIQIP